MTLTRLVAASAFALSLAAPALADDRDTIMDSCQIQATIPNHACPCIADRVMAEFNEKEMAFFLAVITSNQQAQMQAQGNLTMNEMQHVAMRMTQLPGECS